MPTTPSRRPRRLQLSRGGSLSASAALVFLPVTPSIGMFPPRLGPRARLPGRGPTGQTGHPPDKALLLPPAPSPPPPRLQQGQGSRGGPARARPARAVGCTAGTPVRRRGAHLDETLSLQPETRPASRAVDCADRWSCRDSSLEESYFVVEIRLSRWSTRPPALGDGRRGQGQNLSGTTAA